MTYDYKLVDIYIISLVKNLQTLTLKKKSLTDFLWYN